MRTVEKTVYTFDELTDDTKEKVRNWYRADGLDYDWWDFVYDDAATIADLFGLTLEKKGKSTPKIYFSWFYCQGQGSSFRAAYRYVKGAAKAVRAYAPQDKTLHAIVDGLQDVQRRKFYALTADVRPANRETSISVDVHDKRVDGWNDEPNQETVDDVTYWLEQFNDWIFSRLRDEYEHLTSDDVVDESIRANEYEFTEYGEIY